MLSLRNATEADLGEIQRIYEYAQDYMIRSGNPTQWGRSYPSADLIRSDIQKRVCKVIYDETGIHGVFALFDGAEPTYAHIEEGEWLNDEPYVTIHRLAGDGRVHGLFQCAADHCKSISPNVRVDTHANNTTMQRLIEKNGFKKCGIIHVRDGSRRASVRVPVRGRRYSLRRGLSVAPDHSGFIVEPYSILISARTFCGSTHG